MFYESPMWVGIFIVGSIAFISGIIFLMNRTDKFLFLDKLSFGKKHFRRFLPLILLLVLMLTLYLLFGYMNAIVIMITLTVIWAIVELVIWLLKKANLYHPRKNYNYAACLTILLSVVYLSYGWFLAHNVVSTEYTVTTVKDIEPLRVVFFSDTHVGATFKGNGFSKVVDKIQACNPDVVLITGDYVDGSSSYEDLVEATAALGNLDTNYGVYYVYGNHDRNFFLLNKEYSEEMFVSELEKNNVKILQDELVVLSGNISLIGREDADDKNRLSISELVNMADTDSFLIDMNHQPNDYDAEEASGVDLVLSGHTHGGQLLPIRQVGKWIGATDKIYGLEKRSDTTFIVSSGVSDWGLGFKTGCKAEFVVVDILHTY